MGPETEDFKARIERKFVATFMVGTTTAGWRNGCDVGSGAVAFADSIGPWWPTPAPNEAAELDWHLSPSK